MENKKILLVETDVKRIFPRLSLLGYSMYGTFGLDGNDDEDRGLDEPLYETIDFITRILPSVKVISLDGKEYFMCIVNMENEKINRISSTLDIFNTKYVVTELSSITSI